MYTKWIDQYSNEIERQAKKNTKKSCRTTKPIPQEIEVSYGKRTFAINTNYNCLFDLFDFVSVLVVFIMHIPNPNTNYTQHAIENFQNDWWHLTFNLIVEYANRHEATSKFVVKNKTICWIVEFIVVWFYFIHFFSKAIQQNWNVRKSMGKPSIDLSRWKLNNQI